MRSALEIRFRLAQQLDNLRLFVFKPGLKSNTRIADLPLPDSRTAGQALRGTSYASEIEELAKQILAHEFSLLGQTIATGKTIEWRKDYLHGPVSGLEYFRFVPYLDFSKAGDHKNIWELNRHQHLVLLAQAWILTGNASYLAEVESQLESWFEQNPYLRGINFASALEVAFRALSWLWIDHLVGEELTPRSRQKLRLGMLQSGYYLEANLSTYFSPNTHLLGEGVALYALGLKFPESGWELLGRRVVEEERDRQIQADGSHFEQSTYYHVYALDFFLFYYILAGRPSTFLQPLRRMAHFLDRVQGPAGLLSFFGDDDGGRLFHPYGERAEFGRATLATCSQLFPDLDLPRSPGSYPEQAGWWLPVAAPADEKRPQADFATVFPQSGLVAIARGDLHLLIDTGPFGPGGAGHSHSDTLSLTVRSGARELLIDPGTFTYVSNPRLRDEFRGSGFHNTIRVDERDQADPTRPFRWDHKPQVVRSEFQDAGATVYLDARCRFREVTHRRRFLLFDDRLLVLLDELTGPDDTLHEIEQFWHLGACADTFSLLSSAPCVEEHNTGRRSRCFGTQEESPVIVFRWKAKFPVRVATVLSFKGERSGALQVSTGTNSTVVEIPGFPSIEFPDSGVAGLVSA